MSSQRHAAVCLVVRDGLILCVWNRRYSGWTLPGGMVEPHVDVSYEAAAKRELQEETGLVAGRMALVHEGPADPSMVAPGRASTVHVFRVAVDYHAQPEEREHGCPIAWLTQEEFLSRVPFKAFYADMFAKLPKAHTEEQELRGH